jgi:ribulose 1,5-bisphosphate synthetase/thiazole synthase
MFWLLPVGGSLDSSSLALCLLLSGHNGLVAAAYLAKQGRKVLVLERRYILGGAAVTEEINPGQSRMS